MQKYLSDINIEPFGHNLAQISCVDALTNIVVLLVETIFVCSSLWHFVSFKMIFSFPLYFISKATIFSLIFSSLTMESVITGKSKEKNIMATSLGFSPSFKRQQTQESKKKRERNPCRTNHWYFECVLLASNGIRFNKFISIAHCFIYAKYNLRLLHWTLGNVHSRLVTFFAPFLSLSLCFGPRALLCRPVFAIVEKVHEK